MHNSHPSLIRGNDCLGAAGMLKSQKSKYALFNHII